MKSGIKTDKAPSPIGPYSQGIRVGNFLFVSGQGGLTPDGRKIQDDIKSETRQTMENLRAILEAGGCTFDDVVKVNIYVTDIGNFKDVNEVYGSYFKKTPPARATVEVSRLPMGFHVEIDCVAYAP